MLIFNYSDYRVLIRDWETGQGTRGTRSHLSRAARCSPSWMTRVLSGNVQLTPDQALGIAEGMSLGEEETDYFLLLVDLERASTAVLKKRIQGKIESLRRESFKISTAVKTDSVVSEEFLTRYYSSWLLPSVHVACMIKKNSPVELARTLGIHEDLIVKSLKSLLEMSLVKLEGPLWSATSHSVHLPSGHPFAKVIHSSWRNRTIHKLQEGRDDGLHYSAIHCLAKKDQEIVQSALKDAVLRCRKIIEDSPAEALSVLCVDWYGL